MPHAQHNRRSTAHRATTPQTWLHAFAIEKPMTTRLAHVPFGERAVLAFPVASLVTSSATLGAGHQKALLLPVHQLVHPPLKQRHTPLKV